MAFINTVELNYPVEEVFKVFIRTAKRDFPKFNEKNPIGASVTRKAGNYSTKQSEVRVELTDYKLNEVYQITTAKNHVMFVSTYTFKKIDEYTTELTLEESDSTEGFFKGINSFMQNFLFKKRIKKRFSFLVQGLENEILEHRKKVEAAKPKKDKVDQIEEESNLSEVETI